MEAEVLSRWRVVSNTTAWEGLREGSIRFDVVLTGPSFQRDGFISAVGDFYAKGGVVFAPSNHRG